MLIKNRKIPGFIYAVCFLRPLCEFDTVLPLYINVIIIYIYMLNVCVGLIEAEEGKGEAIGVGGAQPTKLT